MFTTEHFGGTSIMQRMMNSTPNWRPAAPNKQNIKQQRIRPLMHPKVQQMKNSMPHAPIVQKNKATNSTPDALMELENAQTDTYIMTADHLGGTSVTSRDAAHPEVLYWRKAAEQK
jgi:myo-inositol-1-phosphate synthase